MVDGHIHIEKGAYTIEWISQFVNKGLERGLDEIWLLEHCYRFREFVPMYDSVCVYSEYVNKWFSKNAGMLKLEDYLRLIQKIREYPFPIRIRFGLEICYFEEYEEFAANLTKEKGFDFLLGSVHFVDGFAFDHKAEHWNNLDVDKIYRRYFETSAALIESGVFDGIAHPDCIKLFGHTPSFSLMEDYEKIARALAKQDMYAEQSSGICRRCPDTAGLGMNKDMLRSMKKHNVKIVTASDAHCPEDVGSQIPELNELIANA